MLRPQLGLTVNVFGQAHCDLCAHGTLPRDDWPYCSITSFDFLSAISWTLSSYFLSRSWTSSLPLSRSSSVISLAFSPWSKCLLASRRMLRSETLHSSADF